MTSTITEKVSRTEGLTWFQRLVRRFKPASSESGPEYSSLVDDDEESSIASGEERRPKEKETKGGWQWLKAVALLRYPLYISIVIHSFILADLVWAHWFGRVTFGEYGKGFNTDFDLPKNLLKLEKVRFTHSLHADDNGTIYGKFRDDDLHYVGTPSPEIDANWEYLVGGRYVKLYDHEVEKMNKDDGVPDLTPVQAAPGVVDIPGYYGSVDMVHNLHCLNTIRQQLDPDYYEQNVQTAVKHAHRMKMRMHVDHCIDQIRQAILCHGDLTPVSLRPVLMNDPTADLVGETEREHTCRNWKAVREWLTERGEKNGFLPPKKAHGGHHGGGGGGGGEGHDHGGKLL